MNSNIFCAAKIGERLTGETVAKTKERQKDQLHMQQENKQVIKSSDYDQIPNSIINIFLFSTAAHVCGLLRPAWAHPQITVQKLLCLSERPVKGQFHRRTHAQQHIYNWLSHHNTKEGTKGTGGGKRAPNIKTSYN